MVRKAASCSGQGLFAGLLASTRACRPYNLPDSFALHVHIVIKSSCRGEGKLRFALASSVLAAKFSLGAHTPEALFMQVQTGAGGARVSKLRFV